MAQRQRQDCRGQFFRCFLPPRRVMEELAMQLVEREQMQPYSLVILLPLVAAVAHLRPPQAQPRPMAETEGIGWQRLHHLVTECCWQAVQEAFPVVPLPGLVTIRTSQSRRAPAAVAVRMPLEPTVELEGKGDGRVVAVAVVVQRTTASRLDPVAGVAMEWCRSSRISNYYYGSDPRPILQAFCGTA